MSFVLGHPGPSQPGSLQGEALDIALGSLASACGQQSVPQGWERSPTSNWLALPSTARPGSRPRALQALSQGPWSSQLTSAGSVVLTTTRFL